MRFYLQRCLLPTFSRIHESEQIAGRANRLFKRLAAQIFIFVIRVIFVMNLGAQLLCPSGSAMLSIPSDVLEHHILKELHLSSLVACSLVSQLRRLSSLRLSALPKNKFNQSTILQDIFRNGSANLLSWFQACLQYPSIADLATFDRYFSSAVFH